MANADPYQYALRRAMDSGGEAEPMAHLRDTVEVLCGELRSEGVAADKATESVVRIASDLLLPEIGAPGTHDLAQQIVDDVELWCVEGLRGDAAR